MKNLLKVGMFAVAVAFGLMFIGVGSANAQNVRKERREYRKDVPERATGLPSPGESGKLSKANREYREDIRDARKDYRKDTGRRYNRRRYQRNSTSIRPTTRYYYRNGRRYMRRY